MGWAWSVCTCRIRAIVIASTPYRIESIDMGASMERRDRLPLTHRMQMPLSNHAEKGQAPYLIVKGLAGSTRAPSSVATADCYMWMIGRRRHADETPSRLAGWLAAPCIARLRHAGCSSTSSAATRYVPVWGERAGARITISQISKPIDRASVLGARSGGAAIDRGHRKPLAAPTPHEHGPPMRVGNRADGPVSMASVGRPATPGAYFCCGGSEGRGQQARTEKHTTTTSLRQQRAAGSPKTGAGCSRGRFGGADRG